MQEPSVPWHPRVLLSLWWDGWDWGKNTDFRQRQELLAAQRLWQRKVVLLTALTGVCEGHRHLLPPGDPPQVEKSPPERPKQTLLSKSVLQTLKTTQGPGQKLPNAFTP